MRVIAIRRKLQKCLLAFCFSIWPCFGASVAEEPPKLAKIRVAPDSRSFRVADERPSVPLGVNYYRPGTGWARQLWKQFDTEATRNDFARMKELGVNCVRVFLSFGSFFTEPDALDQTGLAKFDELLGIAEETGIYLHPTGPDHWEGVPGWAAKDRVADDQVLTALENFWRLFAGRQASFTRGRWCRGFTPDPLRGYVRSPREDRPRGRRSGCGPLAC